MENHAPIVRAEHKIHYLVKQKSMRFSNCVPLFPTVQVFLFNVVPMTVLLRSLPRRVKTQLDKLCSNTYARGLLIAGGRLRRISNGDGEQSGSGHGWERWNW